MAGQLSSERSSLRAAEETLTQKRRAEWSAEATIKQLEVEKGQLQRKVKYSVCVGMEENYSTVHGIVWWRTNCYYYQHFF